MRGTAHMAAGLTAGITTAYFAPTDNFGQKILIATFAVLGGVLPDIDHPNSTIGKKVKPLAKQINKIFGHRTITHAPSLYMLLLFIFLKCMEKIPEEISIYLNYILLGLFVGVCSHLIGDMFTKGGIPMFYPITKKKYRITKVKTGDADALFVVLTSIIFISLGFGGRYLGIF